MQERMQRLLVRLAVGTTAIGLAAAVVMGPGTVSAAAAETAPITDYASYPAPLPEGCPDGPAAALGVSYSNGRGGETTDLQALSLAPGDTLTVSWDSFAPGCADGDGAPLVAVSLAAYDASTPAFDMHVDQALLAGWAACGADQGPCAAGPGGGYQLSLVVPGPNQSRQCNVQLDFVIGLPLAVVGPSGSYYNAVLRGDGGPSMGIGNTNLAIPDCVPGVSPQVTTPVTPTTVTTPVPPTTVTTAGEVPPPTPSDVGPVAVQAAAVTTPPAGATEVMGARASRQPEQTRIPATGAASGTVTLVGSALLLAGTALVLVGRRVGERRA